MPGPGDRDFGRCPLCGADAEPYAVVGSGRYQRCPGCRLVFQDRAELPGREAEQAFYEPFTFQWIADRYRWRMASPSRTVFLFRKPEV